MMPTVRRSQRIQEQTTIVFNIAQAENCNLEELPWAFPLETWPDHGILPMNIRRGESRHPVIFIECGGNRYAIKETTPRMAEKEIGNLREIERRGIPALSPVGTVMVSQPPIPLDVQGTGGIPQYISADRGYTVTRLAPRIIPHVILYRIPFTKRNKRRLWDAVAVLMIELHEHGVYWGDPSLANILIRIDGKRIFAIMADAETSELFDHSVSEGLRQQDLEMFHESLLWQAEDVREARNLPESDEIVDDSDFIYFNKRYRLLRREHDQFGDAKNFDTPLHIQLALKRLNSWGYAVLDMGSDVIQRVVTVRPGWYQRRIYELLNITVPRQYARQFYNLMLGHQYLMEERQHRPVSIEEAAEHWYTNYHLPLILLLRQNLTQKQDPMRAYFEIMDTKWKLSQQSEYDVPLEDAMLNWAMVNAESGRLGRIDPAALAAWWNERKAVAEVLEPPLIEGQKLEPLLQSPEKPLVHLPKPALDQELTGILSEAQAVAEEEA